MQSLRIKHSLQKFAPQSTIAVKIAFVANTSWNIYNFRKGLVHQFLTQGDDVILLAPKDEYTSKVEQWGVKWIETPLDGTGINPVNDFSYILRLIKIFTKESPDVILGYTIKANIYACLASAFRRMLVICNVSGLGTVFLVKGLAGTIAKRLYQIAFRMADHIFFQNQDDRNLFTSVISVNENKVSLLPGSGINLEDYQYSVPVFDKPTKFIMISRLIVEKGVINYVEAASLLKSEKMRFTLVGRLDESHSRSISKADLKKWIANGWITYLPHCDHIEELIQEHEVVVLPSYREGTPRTLLEGAALGRALLAADVPGCREVVQDGVNGFVFEVKNSEELKNKIKLYCSLSVEEKKRLSLASRKIAEDKFDEKIVIDLYQEVIRRLTASD